MERKINILLRRVFWVSLLLIGLALLILLAVNTVGSGEIKGPITGDLEGAPLYQQDETHGEAHPEPGQEAQLRVPEYRIPKTHEARLTAAPTTLLPNHLGETPAVDVPTNDRQQLAAGARAFLRAWETYKPGEPKGAYEQRITPFSASGKASLLTLRIDSHQTPIACPEPRCGAGSSWIDEGSVVVIRAYDERNAYLTTYGAIRYLADPQHQSYLGAKEFSRAYALLMVKEGNEWKVERAVAETIGEL
jgi:hypothetical protein